MVTAQVADNVGTPLSVTRTWNELVEGPVASPVDHVIRPDEGFRITPGGALEPRLKVSVWDASGSEAANVSESDCPSSTVTLVEAVMTGVELLRLTNVTASGCAGAD